MTVYDKEVLVAAIEQWGNDKQTDQLIEEMGELIQEIIHCRRAGTAYKSPNLIEEIADVSICLEQLKIIVDSNFLEGYFDEHLQAFVDRKLARLQSRIDMATKHSEVDR